VVKIRFLPLAAARSEWGIIDALAGGARVGMVCVFSPYFLNLDHEFFAPVTEERKGQ
jgi:hypothetical protein